MFVTLDPRSSHFDLQLTLCHPTILNPMSFYNFTISSVSVSGYDYATRTEVHLCLNVCDSHSQGQRYLKLANTDGSVANIHSLFYE